VGAGHFPGNPGDEFWIMNGGGIVHGPKVDQQSRDHPNQMLGWHCVLYTLTLKQVFLAQLA